MKPGEKAEGRPGGPGIGKKKARGIPPSCFKVPWPSQPSLWLFVSWNCLLGDTNAFKEMRISRGLETPAWERRRTLGNIRISS